MSDYQEHITALRVLIVSGAVRGRTVEYSGDEALAMTDHLNAIETALAAERAKTAKLVEAAAEAMAALSWAKANLQALSCRAGNEGAEFPIVDRALASLRGTSAAITEAGQ